MLSHRADLIAKLISKYLRYKAEVNHSKRMIDVDRLLIMTRTKQIHSK